MFHKNNAQNMVSIKCVNSPNQFWFSRQTFLLKLTIFWGGGETRGKKPEMGVFITNEIDRFAKINQRSNLVGFHPFRKICFGVFWRVHALTTPQPPISLKRHAVSTQNANLTHGASIFVLDFLGDVVTVRHEIGVGFWNWEEPANDHTLHCLQTFFKECVRSTNGSRPPIVRPIVRFRSNKRMCFFPCYSNLLVSTKSATNYQFNTTHNVMDSWSVGGIIKMRAIAIALPTSAIGYMFFKKCCYNWHLNSAKNAHLWTKICNEIFFLKTWVGPQDFWQIF